jgi:Rod binding domain-containing protein
LRIDLTGFPGSIKPDTTLKPDKAGLPSKESVDAERARGACKDFESILIYNLLSSMRRAFKSDEDSDQGFGNDIFKSMMDEQMSIAIAKAGGIGLADILEKGLGLVGSAKQSVAKIKTITPAQPKHEPRSPESVGKLRPYESTIKAAGQRFGVDPNLLRAVIWHESAGDPQAVSPKGAKGLMQLMDVTAQQLGVTNSFDPIQNIFGGARLLGKLLQTFKGNLELALASYNAGQGAVQRHGGVPPYKETQDYIKKVADTFHNLTRNGSVIPQT